MADVWEPDEGMQDEPLSLDAYLREAYAVTPDAARLDRLQTHWAQVNRRRRRRRQATVLGVLAMVVGVALPFAMRGGSRGIDRGQELAGEPLRSREHIAERVAERVAEHTVESAAGAADDAAPSTSVAPNTSVASSTSVASNTSVPQRAGPAGQNQTAIGTAGSGPSGQDEVAAEPARALETLISTAALRIARQSRLDSLAGAGEGQERVSSSAPIPVDPSPNADGGDHEREQPSKMQQATTGQDRSKSVKEEMSRRMAWGQPTRHTQRAAIASREELAALVATAIALIGQCEDQASRTAAAEQAAAELRTYVAGPLPNRRPGEDAASLAVAQIVRLILIADASAAVANVPAVADAHSVMTSAAVLPEQAIPSPVSDVTQDPARSVGDSSSDSDAAWRLLAHLVTRQSIEQLKPLQANPRWARRANELIVPLIDSPSLYRLALASSERDSVRSAAAELLRRRDPGSLRAFLTLVDHPRCSPAALAAVADVGELPEAELLTLLASPRREIRLAASLTLAQLPRDDIVTQLIQKSSFQATRQAALVALVASNHPLARQFVRRAQDDLQLLASIYAAQHVVNRYAERS